MFLQPTWTFFAGCPERQYQPTFMDGVLETYSGNDELECANNTAGGQETVGEGMTVLICTPQ